MSERKFTASEVLKIVDEVFSQPSGIHRKDDDEVQKKNLHDVLVGWVKNRGRCIGLPSDIIEQCIPIPCDNLEKFGDWGTEEYARKLDEEHGELNRALGVLWGNVIDDSDNIVAEALKEACDVIIATFSLLDVMGFTKYDVLNALRAVNENNRKRGYHEE